MHTHTLLHAHTRTHTCIHIHTYAHAHAHAYTIFLASHIYMVHPELTRHRMPSQQSHNGVFGTFNQHLNFMSLFLFLHAVSHIAQSPVCRICCDRCPLRVWRIFATIRNTLCACSIIRCLSDSLRRHVII
jgi:hypothetical protein